MTPLIENGLFRNKYIYLHTLQLKSMNILFDIKFIEVNKVRFVFILY